MYKRRYHNRNATSATPGLYFEILVPDTRTIDSSQSVLTNTACNVRDDHTEYVVMCPFYTVATGRFLLRVDIRLRTPATQRDKVQITHRPMVTQRIHKVRRPAP